MTYTVSCPDLGIEWCDHIVSGETEDELIENAIIHGREHNDIDEEQLRTPEFVAMLRNAMKQRD